MLRTTRTTPPKRGFPRGPLRRLALQPAGRRRLGARRRRLERAAVDRTEAQGESRETILGTVVLVRLTAQAGEVVSCGDAPPLPVPGHRRQVGFAAEAVAEAETGHRTELSEVRGGGLDLCDCAHRVIEEADGVRHGVAQGHGQGTGGATGGVPLRLRGRRPAEVVTGGPSPGPGLDPAPAHRPHASFPVRRASRTTVTACPSHGPSR